MRIVESVVEVWIAAPTDMLLECQSVVSGTKGRRTMITDVVVFGLDDQQCQR